jgi:hypothetical protein
MCTFAELPIGSTFDMDPDEGIRRVRDEWHYWRRIKLALDLARDDHGFEYKMSPEREVFHVEV